MRVPGEVAKPAFKTVSGPKRGRSFEEWDVAAEKSESSSCDEEEERVWESLVQRVRKMDHGAMVGRERTSTGSRLATPGIISSEGIMNNAEKILHPHVVDSRPMTACMGAAAAALSSSAERRFGAESAGSKATKISRGTKIFVSGAPPKVHDHRAEVAPKARPTRPPALAKAASSLHADIEEELALAKADDLNYLRSLGKRISEESQHRGFLTLLPKKVLQALQPSVRLNRVRSTKSKDPSPGVFLPTVLGATAGDHDPRSRAEKTDDEQKAAAREEDRMLKELRVSRLGPGAVEQQNAQRAEREELDTPQEFYLPSPFYSSPHHYTKGIKFTSPTEIHR